MKPSLECLMNRRGEMVIYSTLTIDYGGNMSI